MKENKVIRTITETKEVVVSYTSDDGLYTSKSYAEIRNYEYNLEKKRKNEKIETILCSKIFSKAGKPFQITMLYEDNPELFFVLCLSPEEKESLSELASDYHFGISVREFLEKILLVADKESFIPLYIKKSSDNDSIWDCSAASKLLQEKRNIEETLRIMKSLEKEPSNGKD